MARGKYRRKRERQQRRQMRIADLPLSEKIIKLLTEAGIQTIENLDRYSDSDLSQLPNFKKDFLTEIQPYRQ